jgi:N-acetylneuraminic acid mutarotase
MGRVGMFELSGNLAEPRIGASAVVIGNSLYVIGGVGLGEMAKGTVERALIAADGTLGTFEIVDGVSLVTPRSQFTATVIGNSLYVIGGLSGSVASNGLDSIERAPINPDGTLGPFAMMPGVALRAARGAHAAMLLGPQMVVMGGASGIAANGTVETASIDENGNLGTFSNTGTLSADRAGMAATLVHDRIYLIGGVVTGSGGAGNITIVDNADHSSLNDGGDPDTFAGSTFAIPNKLDFGFDVSGGAAFIIGGQDLTGIVNTIDRAPVAIDGTVGAFQRVSGVTLQTARSFTTIATIGNKIHVLGGLGAGGATLASVETSTLGVDLEPGAFTPSSGLGAPKQDASAAVVGSTLYVFGGRTGATNITTIEEATINADGSLSSFTQLAGLNLPSGRRGHCTVVLRDKIHLIGGGGNNDQPTGSVDTCTLGTDGRITQCTTTNLGQQGALTTSRRTPTCAVVGKFVYVFGGDPTNQTIGRSIERSQIQFDGSLGAFTALSANSLQSSRSNGVATPFGNTLYVFGGNGGNEASPTNAEQTTLR